MSALYEAYVRFPRYDARVGHGYGAAHSKVKPGLSVGKPMSLPGLYPYKEPPTEVDDDGEDLPPKAKKKVINKVGGIPHINDPFSSNWVDRGAFVNWATRLDLYEGPKNITLKDVVKGLEGSTSTGGMSQFSAMGNGAGIYKTRPGKTIGMNIGGRPQSQVATKTSKKIPPSLSDFIKNYLRDEDEEI